jgi:hypothetical protein
MPDSVITTSMRGRPSSSSGIRSAPDSRPKLSNAGLHAHQRQRLGDRAAIGLDVVRPPQHQRDRARQRLMGLEQQLGLLRAVRQREGGGHAERVEGVDVAARGQHLGRCGSGRRPARRDIAPVERAHQRRAVRSSLQQPSIRARVSASVSAISADARRCGLAHRPADDVQPSGISASSVSSSFSHSASGSVPPGPPPRPDRRSAFPGRRARPRRVQPRQRVRESFSSDSPL